MANSAKCALEFGDRAYLWSDHQGRNQRDRVQGLHRSCQQGGAAVRDQERHDRSPGNAQGFGADQAVGLSRTIFTIGHSTRDIVDVVALLRQVDVDLVVDVRSTPRSRANPQFNVDSLPGSLAPFAMSYRWLPALGGRRHHPIGTAPSVNTFWRVMAFRNYADYAETDAFRAGLQDLLELSQKYRCAIMCAEAVWWRCHRRIIADHLLARGVPVAHVMGLGQVTPATLTAGAVVMADGTLRYLPPESEGTSMSPSPGRRPAMQFRASTRPELTNVATL